jgi:hypothetical protein
MSSLVILSAAQPDISANIDPKGLRTDAELNDLLAVVRNSSGPGSSLREKLQLDAEVTGEGGNFSVGERQLRKHFPEI